MDLLTVGVFVPLIQNNQVNISLLTYIENVMDLLNDDSRIFIDIPIGLSSKSIQRKIDQELREKLPMEKK